MTILNKIELLEKQIADMTTKSQKLQDKLSGPIHLWYRFHSDLEDLLKTYYDKDDKHKIFRDALHNIIKLCKDYEDKLKKMESDMK